MVDPPAGNAGDQRVPLARLGLPQHLISTLEIATAGFLPGALAGFQVTALLFFLNPHLELSTAPVLRGCLVYGLLLGGLSLALHLPFTWGRPRRARRALPWGLTLALALAAASDWAHASLYAYYLPPGINQRLLKAAVWLSVAALIGFYTALAHRPQGRPYGWRSRFLYAFLTLASAYVVIERRDAFSADLSSDEPRPTTVDSRQRPLLLVVGLEGATLDAILPLVERGRLPFFAKMLNEGAHGRLSSLNPPLRATLWTTLATGKYPYQHGIVSREIYNAGFLAPGATYSLLPVGVDFTDWGTFGRSRPFDAADKRTLDIWHVFSRLGVPTAVIGWPLTAPVSASANFLISESFFDSAAFSDIYPPELAERTLLFRTEIAEIDPADAGRFGAAVPEEALEHLAGDLWRESLSLFLLDQNPQLEAMFLLLPGLSKMSLSYFGAFEAVQFEGAQNPESVHGAQMLSAYYAHLDEFLASLWQRRLGPRLLVVTSARGTEGQIGYRELRRLITRQPALRGSFEGAPAGALMLLGDGIAAGTKFQRADLVDLAPTLLYCLGFPVADDFDGKLLTEALDTGFLARQPLTFIPSYESLADRGTAVRPRR